MAAGAAVGASGALALRSLYRAGGETTLESGFIYTAPSTVPTAWYQNLQGQTVRPSHWTTQTNPPGGMGLAANALWRALVDPRDRPVPGTGFPALILRVPEAKLLLPEGYGGLAPQGFLAFFNICTHLCCTPGFGETHPPEAEDATTRGSQGPLPMVDPSFGAILCPCHDAQWDPLRIVWEPDTSGYNNPALVRYLGASWVWHPAGRALPVIPLEVSGDKLVGQDSHPEWYRGYCGL